MKVTKINGLSPEGCSVTAATDVLGPQVIVKSDNTHLISERLRNHSAAVKLAKRVQADGIGVYDKWTNLHEETLSQAIFRLAFGMLGA